MLSVSHLARRFTVVMLFLIISAGAFAGNYSQLWKQYRAFAYKDEPRSELSVLRQIISQARPARDYGDLLAAEFAFGKVSADLSSDSLQVCLQRLNVLEREARSRDAVLAAVYECALGHIYSQSIFGSNNSAPRDSSGRASEMYALALRSPERLAAVTTSAYTPFITEGADSRIFGNDLLHVIGIEAGRFDLLNSFYNRAGNDAAACLSAVMSLRKLNDDGKTPRRRLALRADSLMKRYSAVGEGCEAAIFRYELMQGDDAVTDSGRYAFLNSAIAQWKDYGRVGELRNSLDMLTQPELSFEVDRDVQLPGRPFTVRLQNVRGVSKVSVSVDLLSLHGNSDYDAMHLEALKKKITRKDIFTQELTLPSRPPYAVSNADSIVVGGLDAGVYLLTLSPSGGMTPCRGVIYVSDVTLLSLPLPGDSVRYEVVSATTGQNLKGGKVVKVRRKDMGSQYALFPCTPADTYHPLLYSYARYSYYENKSNVNTVSVYADRAIYRPGQTVHTAMVCYNNKYGKQFSAVPGARLRVTLRDANYKDVVSDTVTTDAFGTASADFQLPQGGLTGSWRVSVRALDGMRASGSLSFRVDDYKRPSFEVSLEKPSASYHAGDTVTVSGTARGYDGVPVGQGSVHYRVVRRPAFWWWRRGSTQAEVLVDDSAVTADDGTFCINVPMKTDVNGGESEFYRFEITADVTSLSGETRSGELSLPLGTRRGALTCDLPSQVLADSLRAFTMQYHNAAGEPVSATVSYRFDGVRKWLTAPANKAVAVTLRPGRHELTAVCDGDTLRQTVTVFSLADKRPVTETDDWFYLSSTEFPADGSPVCVQIGSSETGQHIFYTAFAGCKVVADGVIDQSDALTLQKYKWNESYGDALCISYAWVRNGRSHVHMVTIRKVLPDKNLRMKWITFRDHMQPGSREQWTLSVSRADGRPAPAQLMATLFDKSLDQLVRHEWRTGVWQTRNEPYTTWWSCSLAESPVTAYTAASMKYAGVKALSLSALGSEWVDWPAYYYYRFRTLGALRAKHDGMVLMSKAAVADAAVMTKAEGPMADNSLEAAADSVAVDDGDDGTTQCTAGGLRTDFSETAFFFPAMPVTAGGTVTLRFTLPESVTTWRFIGMAHDKEMNTGLLEGEAVASKKVMVRPNMPRFLRAGDRGVLRSVVANMSEQQQTGELTMQILTLKDSVVSTQRRQFSVAAGKTVSEGFELPLLADGVYAVRVTAAGTDYSDGEQHELVVIGTDEHVMRTLPFTQLRPGTLMLDVRKLTGGHKATVSLEYAANPAWMMIQALPSVCAPAEKDALSMATALYANAISQHVVSSAPVIGRVIRAWQQEPDSTSLSSVLERNDDLRQLVLDETPWLMEARNESSQRQCLCSYLDSAATARRLAAQLRSLQNLQNTDGSFSWWPGMPSSPYITQEVLRTLVRLKVITGSASGTEHIVSRALAYMQQRVHEEAGELRRLQKKGGRWLMPSELACDWLYAVALDGRALNAQGEADRKYLTDLLARSGNSLTIYGKANAAVILARGGRQREARQLLESIRQYTVYKEEMGRWFDTWKAAYSWLDYKIPTQTAAIEALTILEPSDTVTVNDMRRWLLQSRRTQAWETPVATVNAVWAFMCGNMSVLTSDNRQAVITVDGREQSTGAATAGLGYLRLAVDSSASSVGITKTSAGVSWGALYAQYVQPAAEVKAAASGMAVTRELCIGGKKLDVGTRLHVGQKVTVRIVITADRDYDFVTVIDRRPACLEPARQLSGYGNGYYYAPRDSRTCYYFSRLAKGSTEITTDYVVDREGTYQAGTCSAQCSYAPAFYGNSAAAVVTVVK